MKHHILAVAVLATAFSGCARRPDAIVPADVPMAAYGNQGCPALAQEYLREATSLSALSKQQNDAATGDALGVFLVGVPVSSTFGGDKEGQIAVSKGKVNAIEANMRVKDCNLPSMPVTTKAPAPRQRSASEG